MQEEIIKIINFWQKNAISSLFNREIVKEIPLQSREIIDIIGPRRSGKSSIMKLLIEKIKNNNNWLFINFEDPFFITNNHPGIIEEIIEVFHEYYSTELKYIFFDEIQNINNWETAVRKLRDSEKYRIFITGSSSKLLSSELATLLSGRHRSFKLFPISFTEFLFFHGLTLEKKRDYVIKEKKIIKLFNEYLSFGGFPQIALSRDMALLKQYYEDILQKDIMKRHEIRDGGVLEKMGIFLLSNAAKIVSLASLKKMYDISYEMADRYLGYYKDSFLLFDVPQFSYSIKTQQKSLKKIYAIDTGLANAISFRFSEDKGRILENAVFLQLKRQNQEIYYYKSAYREVDFVVKRDNRKIDLIQVAWEWDNKEVQKRELKALHEAMKNIKKVDNCYILTYNAEELAKIENKEVRVLPVYKWLLSAPNSIDIK